MPVLTREVGGGFAVVLWLRRHRIEAALGLGVQVGRQWPPFGDGQVREQVIDARRADDRARERRVAQRVPEDELVTWHAVEQILDAGGIPTPLALALR